MRRVILALTSTVVGLVLLLSFKTHSVVAVASSQVVTPTTSGTDVSGATATTPSAGSAATPSPVASASTAAKAATTKTVTGDAADTRYGPVQVKITVTNGKITTAEAVVYPENSGRDEQINAYAIPVLNQEAEQAGSASIDMVSGATYTSDGYLQSLQSALDQVA